MANINRAIKPKWNLHDLYNNVEHQLFESVVVEFTDIAGIEIDYYIRMEHTIESDDIYGEPKYQNIWYWTPKRTKLIYDVTEEPTLISPYGINSEDIIQYGMIPKYTFTRDVSAGYTPKPGDVIKTIWNDRNYELADVHRAGTVFQLEKPIWELIMRPYRFSEQSPTAREITDPITIDPTEVLPDTLITPLSAFGDNKQIEEESDALDTYSDVDTGYYGF